MLAIQLFFQTCKLPEKEMDPLLSQKNKPKPQFGALTLGRQ